MRALRIIGFAVLGLVAGYVLGAIVGLILVPEGGSGDAGGREMFVFFGLAPAGALIGAIAGGVVGAKRRGPPPAT